MTDTTIAVSDDVKALIREMQNDGETFNGTLKRLADAYKSEGERWTREEIRAIAKETFREEARR